MSGFKAKRVLTLVLTSCLVLSLTAAAHAAGACRDLFIGGGAVSDVRVLRAFDLTPLKLPVLARKSIVVVGKFDGFDEVEYLFRRNGIHCRLVEEPRSIGEADGWTADLVLADWSIGEHGMPRALEAISTHIVPGGEVRIKRVPRADAERLWRAWDHVKYGHVGLEYSEVDPRDGGTIVMKVRDPGSSRPDPRRASPDDAGIYY